MYDSTRGHSLKPGFHLQQFRRPRHKRQSDYVLGQSSFTLIALFWLEIGHCRGRNWRYGNQAQSGGWGSPTLRLLAALLPHLKNFLSKELSVVSKKQIVTQNRYQYFCGWKPKYCLKQVPYRYLQKWETYRIKANRLINISFQK